jgi:probable phosphoglycerate mutase
VTIVFARHGATDWNRDRRFQGQVDIPLNAQGRAQAQALAKALRGMQFDRAVSSDLSRAYETARAICGQSAVERDARWREFAFGQWEGLTWEEIVSRWPAVGEHGHTLAARYAPPDGETFDAVCARVSNALQDLRNANLQNVLVVTHAGPLHAVLHAVFGERRAEMEQVLGVRFSPASITRLRIDPDGAEVLTLNDVTHLL